MKKNFIRNLGVKTRIHMHHFHEHDVRDGKPIGLPKLNLIKVPDWPSSHAVPNTESVDDDPESNVVDYDEDDENIGIQ